MTGRPLPAAAFLHPAGKAIPDDWCSECGGPFDAREWEDRHLAPDLTYVHADCCRFCPVEDDPR